MSPINDPARAIAAAQLTGCMGILLFAIYMADGLLFADIPLGDFCSACFFGLLLLVASLNLKRSRAWYLIACVLVGLQLLLGTIAVYLALSGADPTDRWFFCFLIVYAALIVHFVVLIRARHAIPIREIEPRGFEVILPTPIDDPQSPKQ